LIINIFWLAVGMAIGAVVVLAFPCVWLVGRSLVRRAAELIGL